MRYRTVLCAVTGTGSSYRAALGAALLARENSARLIYVFVVDTGRLQGVTVELPPGVAEESLRRMGEQVLSRAEAIARGQGIVAERAMRKGSPLNVLGEVAREEQADLLVVGRETCSLFDRLLHGKETERNPDGLRKRVGIEAVVI